MVGTIEFFFRIGNVSSVAEFTEDVKRSFITELAQFRSRFSKLSRVVMSALCKLPQFRLISWYGNFVERHSFRIVSGDSPETMRKLCLSTKFPHHEIR